MTLVVRTHLLIHICRLITYAHDFYDFDARHPKMFFRKSLCNVRIIMQYEDINCKSKFVKYLKNKAS